MTGELQRDRGRRGTDRLRPIARWHLTEPIEVDEVSDVDRAAA